MIITGRYYPAGSSQVLEAELEINDSGYILPGHQTPSCYISELTIAPRIGNTPRQLRFPEGGLFETHENDLVDELASQYSLGLLNRIIHGIESNYLMILGSLAFSVALIWFLLVKVVPGQAEKIAMTMPMSVATSIGEGSLMALDEIAFEPSQLSEADRQRLNDLFERLAAKTNSPHQFHLEFRDAPDFGPNAFALPDGTVVITDDLVNLAENDEQIAAILAHEFGHVIHRHSLRHVLQSTALTVVLIVVTGDVVSATNLVAAVPSFLLESQYSRSMESEADLYAYTYMKENHIEHRKFAEIMGLMMNWKSKETEGDYELPAFFSTHPESLERIAMFSE